MNLLLLTNFITLVICGLISIYVITGIISNNSKKRILVKAKSNFNNSVPVAYYMLSVYPKLESTGIEVQLSNGFYYIIENNIKTTIFFTKDEFKNYLEVL